MKKLFLSIIVLLLIVTGCSSPEQQVATCIDIDPIYNDVITHSIYASDDVITRWVIVTELDFEGESSVEELELDRFFVEAILNHTYSDSRAVSWEVVIDGYMMIITEDINVTRATPQELVDAGIITHIDDLPRGYRLVLSLTLENMEAHGISCTIR